MNPNRPNPQNGRNAQNGHGQSNGGSRPNGQHQNTNTSRASNTRQADYGRTQYQSSNTARSSPSSYTKEEAERIQKALNKVLGPEYVSFRPGGGGQNVSYIEGWKALNLANEIFGFNGWSSELISVQVDFMDLHGSGRVSLGLSVVVRITIKDGTFHEDFGYGFIENAKNKAMAFEKCKKEAFTDGLKRCLRCFGNVLGNCLYDKTIVAKMQKVKLPASELEHSDFYRDLLVVKRERERLRRLEATTMPTVTNSEPPVTPLILRPLPAAKPENTDMSAQVVRDLADFDDLFQFSDDVAGDDELNDKLDRELLDKSETETETSTGASTVKAPGQVFFTSSKKALEVQQTPDQVIAPYDHKFVSSGRRTVDPSKSVKVRRNDLPPAYSPSQMNRPNAVSPALTSGIGKRPLGMPPSQRPTSKRLHTEISAEKENEEIEKEQSETLEVEAA